jgi:hypothetical protein
MNQRIVKLLTEDSIIKAARELNPMNLTVTKRYYTNKQRIKCPPTTEAWTMVVVEDLTQLIIRRESLLDLEDCCFIAKQICEKDGFLAKHLHKRKEES